MPLPTGEISPRSKVNRNCPAKCR